MTVGALSTGAVVEDGGRPTGRGRPARRRSRWMVATVTLALALCGSGLGYVWHDEARVDHQYDGARQSLARTRQELRSALAGLAAATRDLDHVNGQIHQTTQQLNLDTSQLQAAQAALSDAQGHVVQQGISINNLQACLGGVEQALNALSVGDQGSAIDALDAVAASCQAAVLSNV